MSKATAVLGIVVFLFGAVAGAFLAQIANPPPPESPWRALPPVEEPTASAQIVQLLIVNDAKALSRSMDATLLQRLASSIEPLVDIDEARFTGATERQGDILSAYVAGGRAQTGEQLIVGLVFRMRDGKVVGVN
ncbi:MAG: hypothetical protein FJ028_05010 [Chloroflexi bacterium]|nr:hypothetical protein [Chloroflexota bacterium]